MWPSVTLRSIGDVERTVVVVHSMSMDVPDHLFPRFPAYEERFLCLVLSLLRAPRSRVVYVTSQPILPRLIDYYFCLVPELDTAEARSRFSVVSLVDGRNLPLTRKLLARPGAIERIRALSPAGARVAAAVRHVAGRGRARGPARDPALRRRPGARVARHEDAAAAACSPRRGCRTRAASTSAASATSRAIADSAQRPRARTAIVKLDRGVSGLGNALVDVPRALATARCAARSSSRTSKRASTSTSSALDEQGGIVEERIEGDGLPQPERPASDQPGGPGRHPLDARPGARRAARPDVLRLPLPRRSRVRGR